MEDVSDEDAAVRQTRNRHNTSVSNVIDVDAYVFPLHNEDDNYANDVFIHGNALDVLP